MVHIVAVNPYVAYSDTSSGCKKVGKSLLPPEVICILHGLTTSPIVSARSHHGHQLACDIIHMSHSSTRKISGQNHLPVCFFGSLHTRRMYFTLYRRLTLRKYHYLPEEGVRGRMSRHCERLDSLKSLTGSRRHILDTGSAELVKTDLHASSC